MDKNEGSDAEKEFAKKVKQVKKEYHFKLEFLESLPKDYKEFAMNEWVLKVWFLGTFSILFWFTSKSIGTSPLLRWSVCSTSFFGGMFYYYYKYFDRYPRLLYGEQKEQIRKKYGFDEVIDKKI